MAETERSSDQALDRECLSSSRTLQIRSRNPRQNSNALLNLEVESAFPARLGEGAGANPEIQMILLGLTVEALLLSDRSVRCLSDELSDFRVCAHRLHKNNLIGSEIHAVRFVQLFAPLDEGTLDLFGLGIGLADDVEHVG